VHHIAIKARLSAD